MSSVNSKLLAKFLTLSLCLVTAVEATEPEKAKVTVPQSIAAPKVNQVDSPSIDVAQLTIDAKAGKGLAQYNLAHLYQHGYVVKQDKVQALYWYKKSAHSDTASVRYKIGRLFESGQIFPKDLKQAFIHYQFAAEHGDPYGETNLALMYIQGKGTKQDIPKGIQIAEKVAKRGFVKAQINLASLYNSNYGDVKDIEKAKQWYKRAAAESQHPLAQYELGRIFYQQKDYQQAFEYLDLAVANNNDNAMVMLAMLFDRGLGVEKNRAKSIALLEAAAKLENKQALKFLPMLKAKAKVNVKPGIVVNSKEK